MKYVDDVTQLFASFGEAAGSYQEIQPNYNDFKDNLTSPTTSITQPDLNAALPQAITAEFPLEETAPLLLIGPPVTRAKNVVISLPSPKTAPLPSESMAAPLTGDHPRLSELLRELKQTRRDGLPTPRKQTEAKVIAVVSANGGVGKSTVVAGLAKALRRLGGRTIAIDLDPQNALPSHLGTLKQGAGLIQLKQPDTDWSAHCQPGYCDSELLPFGTGNVDDLRSLKQQMLDDTNWLNRHLVSMNLGENDTVILDTPSGANIYSQQALDAADLVLVITVADAAAYLALDTMAQWLETRARPAQVHRYVLNQQEDSRSFSRDMSLLFQRRLGSDLIKTIRLDHQLNESLAYNQDPLQHAPDSIGCQDILSLARAVHALLLPDAIDEHVAP
ncbi:cellulose biosynthesis protein BcsQ [Pseudomonas sp. B21-048]|uniref:cellulose biosynthesis protein BcsQ n=1 Tax=Pseudomonas sp. B21-048 TaxID=2895490 RepID=UPI00215F61F7|nr:cellulose biosynthesis protein BcsQ [Pseudomonas sp. B21-048]UVK97012.1 cellulose synthase operon protein YhjQ [Pseudomonas sp. B21-048]